MKKLNLMLVLILAVVLAVPLNVSAKNYSLKLPKNSLCIGESITAKLKGITKKDKVKWSTTNKKIATVNQKGKITAKKSGSVAIKVEINNKTKIKTPIVVLKPELFVDVANGFYKKSTQELTIDIKGNANISLCNITNYSKVKWKNSNGDIAIVKLNNSPSDKKISFVSIIPQKVGKTTVVAEYNGLKISCNIIVKDFSIVENPSALTGNIIPADKDSSNIWDSVFVILIPIVEDEINGGNITKYVDHIFNPLVSMKTSDGLVVFASNQYNNCTVDIGNLKSGKYYLMLVDKTKPYPWDEEFSTKFNQDMKVFETLFSKDNFEELKTSIVKDNYIYYKYHYKEITLEPNQSYDISYDFTKQN